MSRKTSRSILIRDLLPQLVICAALLGGASSCSESETPLDWREAVRAGLGSLESLATDTLVVQAQMSRIDVGTGAGGFLLVGPVARGAGELVAQVYMKWDLSTLPEGTVTAAHIDMHLAGVDEADPAGGSYALRIHEILEPWSEDSLNLVPLPEAQTGVTLASAEFDTSGLESSNGVLTLPELFVSEDLLTLARRWSTDPQSNHGVLLRPRSTTAPGFVRFYSSEGLPPNATSALATPLLVVEVQGADTTTVSLEAVDDAFVMAAEGEVFDLAADELVVASGYVHHALLQLDLPPALAPETAARAGIAIVQGRLELPLLASSDWSLAAEEQIELRLYETETDWTQEDPWPGTTLIQLIDRVTVSGEDSVAAFGIGAHLRTLVEGSQRSLVIQSENAIDELQSLALVVGETEGRRARVEIAYERVQDRLGE